MKWIAISLALVCLACAGRSWRAVPPVANLAAPQSCTTNLGPIWTDSLPLVDDTSLQHIVAGQVTDYYPAELKLEPRSGLVRARFAIDTAGRVIPGSSIIEAFSDKQFAEAVCYALPHLKFEPVVRDGRKAVVGLIHVPFTFGVR